MIKDIGLFLFDPITTERKYLTYEELEGITGMTTHQLSVYKSSKRFLTSIGCYLCDNKTTIEHLFKIMEKHKVKELEIWKDTDVDSCYQVSNLGRVRRTYKTREPKFLMPYAKGKNNWMHVKVKYNGKYQEKPLHRLVGELFVEKESNKQTAIIHKSWNLHDNRANNLMWVTGLEVARRGRKSFSIPVLKIDPLTNEILDEYESMKDAADEHYVCAESIRQCVRGMIKTVAGFKFIVDEEFLNLRTSQFL